MAERGGGGDRGGFGRGFGGRGGGRGGDRGGRGGRRRNPRREEEEKWVPVTKLGRLVKDGKIKSIEQIYLHSLPIKEHQIIDTLIGPSLKDEVNLSLSLCIYIASPFTILERNKIYYLGSASHNARAGARTLRVL